MGADPAVPLLKPTPVGAGADGDLDVEDVPDGSGPGAPWARLVIEGSGHFPPLERSEVFFPAIGAFLAGA